MADPWRRRHAGALLDAGARQVTSWRSTNSRLEAPAGQQLTVFQELGPLEERSVRPGIGAEGARA